MMTEVYRKNEFKCHLYYDEPMSFPSTMQTDVVRWRPYKIFMKNLSK